MFDYKTTTHPSHSTVHSLAIKKNIIRDLSEISRGQGGGGGGETAGGSQLFETQKREGSLKMGR